MQSIYSGYCTSLTKGLDITSNFINIVSFWLIIRTKETFHKFNQKIICWYLLSVKNRRKIDEKRQIERPHCHKSGSTVAQDSRRKSKDTEAKLSHSARKCTQPASEGTPSSSGRRSHGHDGDFGPVVRGAAGHCGMVSKERIEYWTSGWIELKFDFSIFKNSIFYLQNVFIFQISQMSKNNVVLKNSVFFVLFQENGIFFQKQMWNFETYMIKNGAKDLKNRRTCSSVGILM